MIALFEQHFKVEPKVTQYHVNTNTHIISQNSALHCIMYISTVKSDQKFRFSETISFKRFLNVILVLKVSLTNSEFFQKFGSEEVPLLATFSHFVATFTNFRISRVPNVRRGSGLNEGVCIDEWNNFFSDNFFIR